MYSKCACAHIRARLVSGLAKEPLLNRGETPDRFLESVLIGAVLVEGGADFFKGLNVAFGVFFTEFCHGFDIARAK